MKNIALGIIDAQRGFMPDIEGQRLDSQGFGELPIQDGQHIVPYIDLLFEEFKSNKSPVFTTQDWHPDVTAHFSSEPNFNTTWPRHCVANTAGARLHPELEKQLPDQTVRFKKGTEVLLRGEDDTSYSGYNAKQFVGNETLPHWLEKQGVTTIVLGGLALDYCVRATALDLRQKADLDVIVVADATEAVAQDTGVAAIDELEAAGVKFMETDEVVRHLRADDLADIGER